MFVWLWAGAGAPLRVCTHICIANKKLLCAANNKVSSLSYISSFGPTNTLIGRARPEHAYLIAFEQNGRALLCMHVSFALHAYSK